MTFGMTMVILYLKGKRLVLDEAGGVFLTKPMEGALGGDPDDEAGVIG